MTAIVMSLLRCAEPVALPSGRDSPIHVCDSISSPQSYLYHPWLILERGCMIVSAQAVL